LAKSDEGGFSRMKRKRFSVEQIVAIVKQAEMGMPVAELIRRVGISEHPKLHPDSTRAKPTASGTKISRWTRGSSHVNNHPAR
jgi:hypothetical protein